MKSALAAWLVVLLGAERATPGVVLSIEPAGEAVCAACRVRVRARVENRSARPAELESLELRWGDRAVHRGFAPPLRLEPGASWLAPEPFELHVAGTYSLVLELLGQPAQRLSLTPDPARSQAGLAQCARCPAPPPGGCGCSTGDAGKACMLPEDCSGACLWARDVALPGGLIYETGRCSAQRALFGCVRTVLGRATREHPQPAGGAIEVRCFD